MATQISAASPAPNFHSEKSYVKKISSFTIQQFVSTCQVKLRSSNQKLQVWIFQGQEFPFRVAKLQENCGEIAAKRVALIPFSSLISLKAALLQSSNNIQWQKKLNWCICLQKYSYKGNNRLKIEHFLLRISFNTSSFCQNIDNFWLQIQNPQWN